MRRLALATLASLALATAGTAQAGSFTYDLNVLANGSTPAVGPILATIADTGTAGTVRITLDLSGAPTAEYADLWFFNFSGTNAQLSDLKFTRNTSLSTSSIGTVTVATSPDGYGTGSGLGGNAGLFDIRFTLPNPNAARLKGGTTLVYDVTYNTLGTGLTASMFNVLSTYNGKGSVYYTAAHIAAIPGADSAGMGSTGVVPEPTSVAMALTSSLCFGIVVLRRRLRTS